MTSTTSASVIHNSVWDLGKKSVIQAMEWLQAYLIHKEFRVLSF